MRIMPVFLWVAVACAARRYHVIIVMLSTHISVDMCGTSYPFLTGERVMKKGGEQVSKVDIVQARKVGRMGGREGGR